MPVLSGAPLAQAALPFLSRLSEKAKMPKARWFRRRGNAPAGQSGENGEPPQMAGLSSSRRLKCRQHGGKEEDE